MLTVTGDMVDKGSRLGKNPEVQRLASLIFRGLRSG